MPSFLILNLYLVLFFIIIYLKNDKIKHYTIVFPKKTKKIQFWLIIKATMMMLISKHDFYKNFPTKWAAWIIVPPYPTISVLFICRQSSLSPALSGCVSAQLAYPGYKLNPVDSHIHLPSSCLSEPEVQKRALLKNRKTNINFNSTQIKSSFN